MAGTRGGPRTRAAGHRHRAAPRAPLRRGGAPGGPVIGAFSAVRSADGRGAAPSPPAPGGAMARAGRSGAYAGRRRRTRGHRTGRPFAAGGSQKRGARGAGAPRVRVAGDASGRGCRLFAPRGTARSRPTARGRVCRGGGRSPRGEARRGEAVPGPVGRRCSRRGEPPLTCRSPPRAGRAASGGGTGRPARRAGHLAALGARSGRGGRAVRASRARPGPGAGHVTFAVRVLVRVCGPTPGRLTGAGRSALQWSGTSGSGSPHR